MGLTAWMRGVLAARKRRSRGRASRHRRDKLLPGLFIRELEDRRVLSVGSLVWASAAGELFIDAGAGADNGVPDAFLLTRQGDQLQVSVDGQLAYTADLGEISSIHVNGSSDSDTLTVDFSNGDPIPFGGLSFDAGGTVQGSDSLIIERGSLGGEIETMTHRFERIDEGQISLSFSSNNQPNRASTIAFTGLTPSDQVHANVSILGGEDDTIRLSGPIDLHGGSLYAAAGSIEVDGTITSSGGRVRLDAGGSGTLLVSGTIDVSAADTGQTGGTVHLLGKQVGLTGTARIDASGDAGGGTILVGGDFQGSNPLIRNATATYVGAEVTLTADALVRGDGGTVVVWSDDVTRFYGTVSARGGASAGNGGFVETSGKGSLVFDGRVDTGAAAGRLGTLLLDPKFIEVKTTGGADIRSHGGDWEQSLRHPDATSTQIITPGSISAANANIVLQANNDVTFTDALSMTSSGKTLTVQAGRSIFVNADISTTNGAITMTANETVANGVVDGRRNPGPR